MVWTGLILMAGSVAWSSDSTQEHDQIFVVETVLTPSAVQARALRRALVAANHVLMDPRFRSLLLERNDLLIRCRGPFYRRRTLDMPRMLEALAPGKAKARPEPYHFTTLEDLRLNTENGRSTGGLHQIQIDPQQRGLRAEKGVLGSLLNIMVHELMHLARRNWTDEVWMQDTCPSRKLYPKRFAYFRARAASYQIGNMAQCFVWSVNVDPCAWETAYRECAASPVRTYGKIRHKPSAMGEYSVDLPECTASASDVAE